MARELLNHIQPVRLRINPTLYNHEAAETSNLLYKNKTNNITETKITISGLHFLQITYVRVATFPACSDMVAEISVYLVESKRP